jgi:uncharacterized membrane protein
MKVFKTWTLERALPWILIIGGVIGLAASFIITVEKIHLLQNPAYVPSCDLNPVISCGSVMSSKQSSAFGFTNTIIGLAAFPVLITTGVVMLAGAKLKRWYMLGLLGGAIFGLLFIHWLFFQSVYRIGSLCPYCMVVWVVTITTFWYTLLYNLRLKYLKLPARLSGVGALLQKHHLDILVAWLLIIAFLILKHFWYYYGPALGL